MKILILGARGMLGQSLYRGLTRNERGTNAEVFGWDREDCDITDEKQAKERISALGPDIIINCAAYNNVDKAENEDKELAMKVNAEAVGHLARISRELNAVLVHYSSEYVFAGDSQEGYAEEAAPAPVNKYGESKLLGENFLRAEAEKYYLIRLSRLFGPAGQSAASKKSFVEMMLEAAEKEGRREFDLLNEEISCPTYSSDLAKLTRQLLYGKMSFGVYHGANSGACTWYEFAREIFKIRGLAVKLNAVSADKFPRPAKRPQSAELLNTKLPKQRSWQEALEEYLMLN